MDDRLEFLARLGIGSSLILLIGLMAIAICRRQSAATQYWLGVWTCLALLLLPLAVAMLPSWQANALSLSVQIVNSDLEALGSENEAATAPLLQPGDGSSDTEVAISPAKDRRNTVLPSSIFGQAKPREDLTAQEMHGRSLTHRQTVAGMRIALANNVAQSLLLVYVLGLVFGLLRLLRAHHTVRKWTHGSQCVSSEAARIAEECRRAMGLIRRVAVRQTE